MKKFYFFTTLIIVLLIVVIVGVVGFFKNQQSKYSFNLSSQTVVQQVRALNRLETSTFTIEKVIDAGTTGNSFQQFLYGDRILLIAHGSVIAGFDMSKMKDSDINVSGKTLKVTLPAPEILVSTLDENQTRVYDRKLGLLTKGDTNLESKARAEAESIIKDAACKGGILDEASKNGKSQLVTLFKSLGFVTVTINIPQGSC